MPIFYVATVAFFCGLFCGVALVCLGCAAARGEAADETRTEDGAGSLPPLARAEALSGGSVHPVNDNLEGT